MNLKDKSLIYHQRIFAFLRMSSFLDFKMYLVGLGQNVVSSITEETWSNCAGYHNLSSTDLVKFLDGNIPKNFIFSRTRKTK